MLISFSLIEGALRVDDLVFAEKPSRVETHDPTYHPCRYLLLFPSERCHVDLDCSNPRSWSGRHVKRVPCAQHAVVHNEAIDRLTSWVSIVVQALANGVGRSINRGVWMTGVSIGLFLALRTPEGRAAILVEAANGAAAARRLAFFALAIVDLEGVLEIAEFARGLAMVAQ